MNIFKNQASAMVGLSSLLLITMGLDFAATKVPKAISYIKSEETGNGITGLVKITEYEGLAYITGIINGLRPLSVHAFHIHEFGDTGDFCKNAGDHYNPYFKKHGSPNDIERHVGDLGNFQADNIGKMIIRVTDRLVKLNAEESVIGRAFVLHAKPDNFSAQPSGDAGSRIACGVIGIAK